MRLICGLLMLDGSAVPDRRLSVLVEQLNVPRLRPAITVWTNGPVGLAMLDFSSRGKPPLPLPRSGGMTLAADVRLDAPADLQRVLDASDTIAQDALLLTALVKPERVGLQDVLGDFAFAGWDATAQRLVCGRDIFGIRPFSYAHQPGRLFAFASLPQALHGSGVVPKTIDEDAVLRRLAGQVRPADSLVAGIQRLPAAHVLEVSRGGLTVRRYWQLDRGAVGKRHCTPQEAARELRRLVDVAVASRLPPDGAIGAHLSGGLDSSSIAVLAARRLRADGRRLHAYSFLDRLRNDVTLEDETEFVQAVLEQEGDIQWTPVRPPVDLGTVAATDVDTMVARTDGAPESAVCARAEAQGVGLILSGWGGDEGATFNGRGAIAEMLRRGQWGALAREIAALKRARGWPVHNIVGSEILHYLLPEAVTTLMQRFKGRPLAGAAVRDSVLSAEARRKLAASPHDRLSLTGDGRENRWRLMTSPHIAERAEVWAQTGARHGVAFAFPLLDRRVVEFALSLPSALFLRDGYRRRPFRDAMANVLPERVRLRHAKYQPFPSLLIDIAESKDAFLAQIAGYEGDAAVCRMLDLGQLRLMVEAFPAPDDVRTDMRRNENPAAMVQLLTAAEMLAAAAYLAQHISRQTPADGSSKAG